MAEDLAGGEKDFKVNMYRESSLGQALAKSIEKLKESSEIHDSEDVNTIWRTFDQVFQQEFSNIQETPKAVMTGTIHSYQQIPLKNETQSMRLMMIIKEPKFQETGKTIDEDQLQSSNILKLYALQDPNEQKTKKTVQSKE